MSRSSRMLVAVSAVVAMFGALSTSFGDTVGTYCPKCGRVHATPTAAGPSAVAQASATVVSSSPVMGQPMATSFQPSVSREMSMGSSGGVSNVLSTLNAQRARQGVGQLAFDPALQAVAERRAALMARTGNKSHPPGSFSPGRYEGVGWSSSYSPSGVSACFTSDGRMRAAGAAMARGRDGVYFAVVYR